MRYRFQDLQDQFYAATLEDAEYELETCRVVLPDIRQDGRLITSLIQVPEVRRPKHCRRVCATTSNKA